MDALFEGKIGQAGLERLKPEARSELVSRLRLLGEKYELVGHRYQGISFTGNSEVRSHDQVINPQVILHVSPEVFEEVVNNEEKATSVLIPPEAADRAWTKIWLAPEVLGSGIALTTIVQTNKDDFLGEGIKSLLGDGHGTSPKAILRLPAKKTVEIVNLKPKMENSTKIPPRPRHATQLPEGLKG